MKKTRVVGLILFVLVISIFNSASILAARINEVELNPPGEDSGNEWIELYSENSVDLSGWRIENVKGKNVSLNGSFSDYKVIITPYNFLANDKQRLKLFNDKNELVGESDVISDASNDARSWQYCSDEWIFKNSSKGSENNCEEKIVKEEITEKNESDNEEEPVNDVKESLNDEKTITSHAIEENLEAQTVVSEPIKLAPKDIKTWKSQEAKIKEYALYGFTLFCLTVLVILVVKNNGKNQEDI